ncbi:MAG TPA: NTP transferase domain-containing protein [Candidatus Limnocylindria bacterium]|nr:NTP transferase domain-containing protein [Candidatus Limnocylindria bacterium]
MSQPSGILLAGGASRRFGRPKIVEPVDGAPLFHSPLRALLYSCDEVVVVIAPDAPEPPLPDGSDRVSFARDEVAYEGPLAGTRIGLERVRGEHAVLLAADMPGVSARLLSLMADRAATGHRKAVVLRDVDGPRPLPAVLMVAPALARARALLESGERRLRALIEDLDADGLTEAVWRQEDPNGTWRRDVDLPEHLPKGTR